MKLKRLLSLITCILFVSTGFGQNTSGEARELLDQFEISLRSKSLDKIAANFHPNCMVLPDGKLPVEGQEGVKALFSALESVNFEEKFTIEESFESDELIYLHTLNQGFMENRRREKQIVFHSRVKCC